MNENSTPDVTVCVALVKNCALEAPDESSAAALLDRLTHHCQIYPFDWESIRLTESLQRHGKKRRKRAVAATAPPAGANKEADQEGAPNPA